MNRPFGPDTGLPRGPEHYWRVIQELGTFTVRGIVDRSNGVGRVTIRSYVVGLIALGYVVEEPDRAETGLPTRFRAAVFRLVRPARIAPVVREAGANPHHGRDAQQIWNAMRVLPQFTIAELAVAASTDERTIQRSRANEFVNGLKRAGLVRVVQPKRGRLNGSTPAIFALTRSANTGPRPPRINKERRGVFDPNRRCWIDNLDRSEVPA